MNINIYIYLKKENLLYFIWVLKLLYLFFLTPTQTIILSPDLKQLSLLIQISVLTLPLTDAE